jgi:hypothetical protein
MKKFTQEQIKMMDRAIKIDRAIKCAPPRQLLMWCWWDMFCKRKADKLIKCLEVGMTWYAAYTIAKNV